MTDFATAPAALPRLAPLDPTKHVNYTLGMVLGVDDFDQEFAYLSGRDRWLARDLSGYGTIWGLDVTIEVEDRGPRINVSPGTAVTPCGQLVCVSAAQCAYVNDWLAANEDEVRARLATSPPGSPLGDTLPLYLVLCYRECATDDLPVPGEPCRTEDTLSAPSRLKDDFRLELRLERPRQREEDAIRDLVAWLRLVPVVDGPGSSVDALLIALRDAASGELDSPPGSPPDGPFDFVLGAPPPGLTIPAADVTEYLRAAFALWVTELRPALRRELPGCEHGCDCGCHGDTGPHGEPCDEDVVLLAEIGVTVIPDLDGDLVAADDGVAVDGGERPYVLHTRFLQELLLAGALTPVDGSPPGDGAPISAVTAHSVTGPPTADWDALARALDLGIPAGAGIDAVNLTVLPPGSDPAVLSFSGGVLTLGIGPGAKGDPGDAGDPGPPGGSFVVAAGRFGTNGGTVWTFNKLEATPVPGVPGLFFMTFSDYDPEAAYAITGTPVITLEERDGEGAPTRTFELVEPSDPLHELLKAMTPPRDASEGFVVRVIADDLKTRARGFNVEVSDYSKVADR